MKICINLFTLSIDEIDCKLLNLFELLIIKFEQYDKLQSDISQKKMFYTSFGKFCLFYFNSKNFLNQEVEIVIYSKLLELSNHFISNIILIKDSFDKETIDKFILSFMKIILTIFQNANIPSLFKQSASKLFNSMVIIKNPELLKKVILQIKELLYILLNNNFEKFFTLFFTLLQFSSKKFLEIKPFEENEEISLQNKTLAEIVDLILKCIITFTIDILNKNKVNF